jgi:hypothetical protein
MRRTPGAVVSLAIPDATRKTVESTAGTVDASVRALNEVVGALAASGRLVGHHFELRVSVARAPGH